MFSIVRNTLNATSCHHYRTPLTQMCRNSLNSGINHYFNHPNCLPQIVRNYSALIKSHNDRRWIKIFKNIWPPERTSGIRSFRQKVRRGNEQKSWSKINENELTNFGFDLACTVTWSQLKRPLLFTIVFSGCALASCAILQYEIVRAELHKKMKNNWWQRRTGTNIQDKAGQIRRTMNLNWNNSTNGEKMFASILAVNVAVFAMWRVPSLAPIMIKYFTCNPQISTKGLPMLLSAFSHQSALHLGCNMFALYSFMDPMVSTLGMEQTLGIYLSSAVITSFFSSVSKVATGRHGSSLGASGAICTVLGSFATLLPDARLQIMLLPFFSFSASMGIKGLMALDTAGILAGWKVFDHAAHLSGVLFGIWWCHWGNNLIWQRREALTQWWHKIRELDVPRNQRD